MKCGYRICFSYRQRIRWRTTNTKRRRRKAADHRRIRVISVSRNARAMIAGRGLTIEGETRFRKEEDPTREIKARTSGAYTPLVPWARDVSRGACGSDLIGRPSTLLSVGEDVVTHAASLYSTG